jgi:hypothetical protein
VGLSKARELPACWRQRSAPRPLHGR